MTHATPTGADRDLSRVPGHVAWVAGGSDRWADAHGASAATLAAAEERALLEVVDGACELGVRWLTVQEPSGGAVLRPHLADLAGRGIRVRRLAAGGPPLASRPGELAPGPADPGLTVMVAAGHPGGAGCSGKEEIVDAIRRLAAEGFPPGALDERTIAGRLYLPEMPDPDLVVRTGADRCVPELLLWEVAYSEFVFLDEPWPDVRREHVAAAVSEYQRRDRRYGGLVASGSGA